MTIELAQVNTQPAEHQVSLARQVDGSLDVVGGSPFATIQGEGPFVGRPAIFVRLAGCDLICPSCDTDYTTGRRIWTVDQLLAAVNRLRDTEVKASLVVITGGEPLRQPISAFVQALLASKYDVQIETNGTLYDVSMMGTYADVTVVCSPKTGSIHLELLPVIDCLKYVLSADAVDPTDGLPTSSLNFGVRPARPWADFGGTVYVSPCDDKDPIINKANTEAAVRSCIKFGYILSLQVHKIVGLD